LKQAVNLAGTILLITDEYKAYNAAKASYNHAVSPTAKRIRTRLRASGRCSSGLVRFPINHYGRKMAPLFMDDNNTFGAFLRGAMA